MRRLSCTLRRWCMNILISCIVIPLKFGRGRMWRQSSIDSVHQSFPVGRATVDCAISISACLILTWNSGSVPAWNRPPDQLDRTTWSAKSAFFTAMPQKGFSRDLLYVSHFIVHQIETLCCSTACTMHRRRLHRIETSLFFFHNHYFEIPLNTVHVLLSSLTNIRYNDQIDINTYLKGESRIRIERKDNVNL